MVGSARATCNLLLSIDSDPVTCMVMPTLDKVSMPPAIPLTAVLMSVGHSEHSITTTAEITKLLASNGSLLVIAADTTIVTIGSQASGLIGRIT